jgi:hypothetical protein
LASEISKLKVNKNFINLNIFVSIMLAINKLKISVDH